MQTQATPATDVLRGPARGRVEARPRARQSHKLCLFAAPPAPLLRCAPLERRACHGFPPVGTVQEALPMVDEVTTRRVDYRGSPLALGDSPLPGAQGGLSGTVTAAGSKSLPESRVIVVGTVYSRHRARWEIQDCPRSAGHRRTARASRRLSGTEEVRPRSRRTSRDARLLNGQHRRAARRSGDHCGGRAATRGSRQLGRQHLRRQAHGGGAGARSPTCSTRESPAYSCNRNADGLRPAHSRARHQQREPVQ